MHFHLQFATNKLQQVTLTAGSDTQADVKPNLFSWANVQWMWWWRNGSVFALCCDDLMLWHVFALQWRCVLFGFLKSPPSSPSFPRLLLQRQQTWRLLHVLESNESRWLCASRLDENGAVVRRLENSSTTLSVFFKRGNNINILKQLGLEHVYYKFNS